MKTVNKIIYKNKEYVSLYLGSTKMYEKKQEVLYDGLTFTALSASTVSLLNYGSNTPDIKYSYDGANWTQWDYSIINLSEGTKIFFKGLNNRFCAAINEYSTFSMTGKIAVSGHLSSISDDGACNTDKENVRHLFQNCTALVDVSNLILKSKDGNRGFYYHLFDGCSNIEKSPVIQLETFNIRDIMGYMFQNCSKLNHITAMLLTTPSFSFTSNWVNGVAASGTFVKNKDATWDVTGKNGIPTGWTVETA